jgi:hypothetical protein
MWGGIPGAPPPPPAAGMYMGGGKDETLNSQIGAVLTNIVVYLVGFYSCSRFLCFHIMVFSSSAAATAAFATTTTVDSEA